MPIDFEQLQHDGVDEDEITRLYAADQGISEDAAREFVSFLLYGGDVVVVRPRERGLFLLEASLN